jgi:hypothetical protein
MDIETKKLLALDEDLYDIVEAKYISCGIEDAHVLVILIEAICWGANLILIDYRWLIMLIVFLIVWV